MNDIIFSNLGNICVPREHISQKRLKTKWTAYDYETDKISGSMLVSPGIGRPQNVSFNPDLKGWYRIFVGMVDHFGGGALVDMKLSDDAAFVHLGTSLMGKYGEHFVEEAFWKCARMDGQQVHIGKQFSPSNNKSATLAWVRFVPMDEKEVADHLADLQRRDTKRIYATNDTHCMVAFYDMSTEAAWLNIVEENRDSDVEWIAMEHTPTAYNHLKDCGPEDFSFARPLDLDVMESNSRYYSPKMLDRVIQYGQSQGFKMCLSLRFAICNIEYPHDRTDFYNDFFFAHPECRCIDRDGTPTDYLSFLYPQVQEYMIRQFVEMAQTGCDAVQPLFSRGWPFILFEQPFLELFRMQFGLDARELPLDDPRIIQLKCQCMTDFMRKLRSRLRQVREEKPVELHAKVLFSLYDNLLVGLDLETWAKEGLVDRIVSDERRIREVLDDCVWQDEGKTRIDLQKYAAYARSCPDPIIQYDYDAIFPPKADSQAILRGPRNQTERVAQFARLEQEYGITAYIEIMPRAMSPEEIQRKALEIYAAGCTHIGLWDTYSRSIRKAEWSMWRRIGHREELADYPSGEGSLYRKVRLLTMDGKQVRDYPQVWCT